MTKPHIRFMFGLAISATLLGGCEQLGIPDPAKTEAQAEADGKAIGSACRHAGRAIEDCFTLNQAAQKAAVFAGWKEMNDYMVENKIVEIAPQLPPPLPPAEAKAAAKAKRAGEKAAAEAQKAHANSDADKDSHGDAEAEAATEPETPRKRRKPAE